MTEVPKCDYRRLQKAPFGAPLIDEWDRFEKRYGRAELGRADRYFLLVVLLHRRDAWHEWIYARCREVEAKPDGHLDLWAREHYKSTVITFAGGIQEILRDPEITIGIFAHTKGISRAFLAQIKTELETNEELKALYPETLWANPQKEAPRWSLDGGIVVRRKTNPKESTVEGWGLVDGQPTAKHFKLLIYDDVVTQESVNTPQQVEKTTNCWGLSDNLGARGADGLIRKWHAGTRYSFADTYQWILDRKVLTPRIYPATDDGTVSGKPVFLTPEAWEQKKLNQPTPILAAQMLQDPSAGNTAMFRKEWLKFSDIRPNTLTVAIMCDPAGSRDVGTDRTAIAVVALDGARNKWLLDGYNHKMSLSERWKAIRDLRAKWMRTPGIQSVYVGYERYGMDSDIDYFEERMSMERLSFEIQQLNWTREGLNSKDDRVQRLEPDFRNGRFYMAAVADGETKLQAQMRASHQEHRIFKPVRQVDEHGKVYSLNARFIEQYLTYPFSTFKDLIDAVSRIYDMEMGPPVLVDEKTLMPVAHSDGM